MNPLGCFGLSTSESRIIIVNVLAVNVAAVASVVLIGVKELGKINLSA